MSLKGVCRHVRMLEGAGLVRPTRDGREKTLHLTAEPLRDAARWIPGISGPGMSASIDSKLFVLFSLMH